MKRIIYCLVSIICLGLFVGSSCPPQKSEPQKQTPAGQSRAGIDLERVETNWTKLALEAKASGQWDNQQRKWKNLSFEGKLPAYVPVFADCGSIDLGAVKNDQILHEIHELVVPQNAKIVLVGEPGFDVDARVQALAWQIAKRCSWVPDAWRGREIISLDLSTIKDDVLAKKLPEIQYLAYVKEVFGQVMNKHGQNAIYYLNEFPVLASTSVDPESILQIFLDANASVIIEATPSEFNRHFSTPERLASVKHIQLQPLPSELVLPAVSALAGNVPEDVVEDIVRLTRAFLPERGFLQNAALALSRMGQQSPGGQPSREHAISAVASLDGRLQKAALAKSEALNRITTLAQIDANVALSRRYYIDQQTKDDIVQGAKQAMEPVIASITDDIRKVEEKLTDLEKRIVNSLSEKVAELKANIDKLGSKLDTELLELAAKMSSHAQAISKELTEVVSRQDIIKAELLLKIAQSQDTLLGNFNAKLGKLSRAQQEMFEQLSAAHKQISDAVANLQKGSNAQMTKIGEIISQQLALEKNLNDATANLSGALSKTNAELASVVLRLDSLSADQMKLFDAVTAIQGTISNTILPKIDELSEAQKSALTHITNGLDTISRSMESTEQSIMTKISDNYRELLVVIENNKIALIADAAQKVAQLNTTFANEIARLDEQGAKQKSEINTRIDGAVSSLTQAIKEAKADLAKSIGDLSVTLDALISKVTALDQKASDSEKALLAQIASATQTLSDSLDSVQAANKKEMTSAIASVTKAHLNLVNKVKDLGSEVLAHKTEILKEMTDKIKDATDKLSDAVSSGKKEALAEVKKANDALVDLTARLGSVELHIASLQKDLTNKSGELQTRIDSLSSKLDSVSLELAKEVKDNTLAISEKLAQIVNRQELDKTDLLEKIANAQEALLTDFTQKLGNLTTTQEEKFKDVSKAHEQIADAIAKADKATATKLAEIVEQQIAMEKSLNTATAQFAGELSKTNGELATITSRLNSLSADQQKLFNTLSDVQKEITNTILPKISELSAAQKDALAQITNGLSTLSASIDSSEQKMLNKIATNYQELVALIEKAKNKAIADSVAKVASLNTAFNDEIGRVDTRIEDAVSSLTEAIKDAASNNKAEFAKSIGDLSVTIEQLITSNSEKAHISQITSATEKLKEAVASGKREALDEVNKANLALAALASRVERVETDLATLQTNLEGKLKDANETLAMLETKIEKGLHAEIVRANKELSDALHTALASGDQKVMDAVTAATKAHEELVSNVKNLSAEALTHRIDLLQKIEHKVKEGTDALKIAIGTRRDEDVAKVETLQSEVSALSSRLGRVEGDVAQLKIDLSNGLKQAAAHVDSAQKNVGSSDALNELSNTVAGLKSQVDSLAQTVSQQKTDLLAELTTRCDELAGTWEKAVKENSEAAVRPLIDTVNQLTQKTNDLGNDLTAAKQNAGAKIQVLIDDHGALKSQVEALMRSRDADSLKTAEAIANAQKALADRVDALEKRGPEYDAIWKELRLANKRLREELDVSIQAAKDGATEAHNAALEQIRELADRQTVFAQNLANTDANLAPLEAELKKHRDDFTTLYNILFRQPQILKANEKDQKRAVKILADCRKETLAREQSELEQNPNLLIVECGISCLVVEREFGFKKGETGDRKGAGFFDIDIAIGATPYKAKVRCVPIKSGSPRTSHPTEDSNSRLEEPVHPNTAAKTSWGYIGLKSFANVDINDSAFRAFEESDNEGLYWAIKKLKEENENIHYPLAVVRKEPPFYNPLGYAYFIVSLQYLEDNIGSEEIKVGGLYSDNSIKYKTVKILNSEPPESQPIAFNCAGGEATKLNGIKGQARCSEEDERHVGREPTTCFYISRWQAQKLPGFRLLGKHDRSIAWKDNSVDYGFSFDKDKNTKLNCGFYITAWAGGFPSEISPHHFYTDPYVALNDLADEQIVNDKVFEAFEKSEDEGLLGAIQHLRAKSESLSYPLAIIRKERSDRLFFSHPYYYVASLKFLKRWVEDQGVNTDKTIEVGDVFQNSRKVDDYKVVRILEKELHPRVNERIPFDCAANQTQMDGIKGQARCLEGPLGHPKSSHCFYVSRFGAQNLPEYKPVLRDWTMLWNHSPDAFTYSEKGTNLYCDFYLDKWAGGKASFQDVVGRQTANPYFELMNFNNSEMTDKSFEAFEKYDDEGLFWVIKELMAKNEKIHYPIIIVRRNMGVSGLYRYFALNQDVPHAREIKVGNTYVGHTGTYIVVKTFNSEPQPKSELILASCEENVRGDMDGIKGLARCSKSLGAQNTKCFYISSWEVKKLNDYTEIPSSDLSRLWHPSSARFNHGFTYVDETNQKLYCGIDIYPWAGGPK